MKVFISKYALTKGIYEVEAEESDVSVDMISTRNDGYCQCFHRGEWHLDRDGAVIKAEEMRKKKLKSLEKQIKKITEMNF